MTPGGGNAGPVGQSLRHVYGLDATLLDKVKYNVGVRAVRRRILTATASGRRPRGEG